MAFLISPDAVGLAVGDLAGIGSAVEQATAAARASTTGVVTAAADEVSNAVAALFSGHGQAFQAASAQVAAFHDRFVQLLSSSSAQYATAEAAAANPLQSLLDIINTPTQLLLGRPLIGDGANGTTINGVGTAGGAGGLLWGNGGRGGDSTNIGVGGGTGGVGGMIGNGGAGGTGGPAGTITRTNPVTGQSVTTAYRGGSGGPGGQGGWFVGNGGPGGTGGVGFGPGYPVGTGLNGGYGGRGGDAVLFGGGGNGGTGGSGDAGFPDSQPGIGGYGGVGGGIPNLFPGIFGANGQVGNSGQSLP